MVSFSRIFAYPNNLIILLIIRKCVTANKPIEANPDAKRLYDDLLSNYNRLIRPVVNNTDKLTVWLGLKLAQLTEVVRIHRDETSHNCSVGDGSV